MWEWLNCGGILYLIFVIFVSLWWLKPSNVGMVELWWDGPRWVAVGCGLCTMHSTVGWDGGSGGGRAVEFGADPAEHLVILLGGYIHTSS